MPTGRSTNPPWVSAQEAAAALGVKRRTLYSYVSRGLLRSRPLQGGSRRCREYSAADIAQLRVRQEEHAGRVPRAGSALGWGAPVLETQVGGIDADGPWLRGHRALDLVERGFEEVVDLLWEWPGPWPELPELPPVSDLRGLQRRVLDFKAQSPDPAVQARELLLHMVASVAGRSGPSVAEALSPAHPEWVNGALILLSEHGLNASTFAARVVASTGGDLVACVSAGLAALGGPKHGCASVALEEALIDGRAIGPGFGHPLYPEGDPRGRWLLARCAPPPALAAHIEEARAHGLHPNVDAGLLSLCAALGWPISKAPLLFALGRCAGWVAHSREQAERPGILRPRAVFGPWVRRA